MRFLDMQVLLQEVPGEISICFTITGCSLRCSNCHSSHLWKAENGEKLTDEKFINILLRYKGYASCVLFMGGEWYADELIQKLNIAGEMGYKTCLYTGEEAISENIMNELTFLKTGPWKEQLGGLDSATTNQKFIDVKNKTLLNHLFQNKEYGKIN